MLKPRAVPIPKARWLLGSQVYVMLGRGELDAVKDGSRTLITLESIERRQAALPTAKFKSPRPPRSHRRQKR